MRILITGATGLIGGTLCRLLSGEGHEVIGLSRYSRPRPELGVTRMYQWDPLAGSPPQPALENIDAVVNLAGEPIAAKRWSDRQKKSIRDTRIITTRNLVDGVHRFPPKVLVSSSAVGFYGSRGDEPLDESSAPGRGFMSEVCQEWEREASRASDSGVRVVLLRTGVVLSADGGALKKMLAPFRMGLGGRLGNGKQWFPWIHIADIAGIVRHSILNSSVIGPINGAAPEPVTNSEFTRELGRVLHRPVFLPVPESALRALMGEMADVLFDSQRVLPRAALASGYEFRFPSIAGALKDLLGT